MATVLMVGTRKGLWVGRSDDARTTWAFDGPHFDVEEIYSTLVDRRDERTRLFVGCSSLWLGPLVRRSDDGGASWQEAPVKFPDDLDASVARIWQLVRGPARNPGGRTIWAGTEPGAVFRSQDDGESFDLVRGLWDHPHRPQWAAGFGGQAFHTILPHPSDPDSVTVAISTGGVYQTRDGGETWTARNHGIRADFLPEGQQYPEFGQCVHKIARDAVRPERLYLQNHGGVYRSDDEGATWISIAAGLPSDFGFAVVAHPRVGDTLFVFPIQAGEHRYPPDAKARVWRSRDAGESWEELSDGLPDRFFVAVMRDAMCSDDPGDGRPAGLYFGARNGAVWGSVDEGDTWRRLVADLPDVMVVRASAES